MCRIQFLFQTTRTAIINGHFSWSSALAWVRKWCEIHSPFLYGACIHVDTLRIAFWLCQSRSGLSCIAPNLVSRLFVSWVLVGHSLKPCWLDWGLEGISSIFIASIPISSNVRFHSIVMFLLPLVSRLFIDSWPIVDVCDPWATILLALSKCGWSTYQGSKWYKCVLFNYHETGELVTLGYCAMHPSLWD